jgi:hypothetical protein
MRSTLRVVGLIVALALAATAVSQNDPLRELWEDATDATIGTTGEWTNKVELADINGDGLVDILFANGGDYETPGTPEPSRVFLNQGPGQMFKEVTESVFGPGGMLARVIKVQDVNNDGQADIMVGTTYQTQSRLYLGDGQGAFTEVTETHLPQLKASIGDLEFGDVDGDGDLDMVLADWGAGSPMSNSGGRTMLWLNDGEGRFTDVTEAQMPDILVKFSWDLEFVDVDNNYDLDILVSCKRCTGSFLFTNDGRGTFGDRSDWLPQFTNNYEFEAMDVDGNGYLDVVTINDAEHFREHLFLNTGQGYEPATAEFWPLEANPSYDDNMVIFLDFDSDGDADFLIASLDGWDRLLVNDGSGRLSLVINVFSGSRSAGTLGMAVADLNGDGRLDVVEGQGENPNATDEKVYLGKNIQPDSAPPVITMVEQAAAMKGSQAVLVRARVHDNKSPSKPHDWQEVVVRWSENGQTREAPMSWYGEYLWRGVIESGSGELYQVCATDAAGNEACSATPGTAAK